MNDEKSAREFGEKALEWAQDLMEWCVPARTSFYLHVFSTHAWRWHELSDHSSYAMEKVNAMKGEENEEVYVGREDERSNRPRARSSMVRVTKLPIHSLHSHQCLNPRVAMMNCSACGRACHLRSSGACPKRSRTMVLEGVAVFPRQKPRSINYYIL